MPFGMNPAYGALPQGTGNRIVQDRGIPNPPEAGIENISVDNRTNMATVKLPLEMLEKAQEAIPFYDRAMVGMQQELDRIQMDESRLRNRNPVLAALTTVASHLGNQPDMPGFVRGLAQASADLNPDPDRLALQKLPIYMQVAKLAEDKAQLLQRNAQIGLQGTAAIQNAEANALYKAQVADARSAGAENAVDKEIRLNRESGVTDPEIYKGLKPNASPAQIASWVKQGEVVKRRLDAEASATNERNLSQADANRARAAMTRTNDILKKRFAPLQAMKMEAEVEKVYAGIALDQYDAKVRAANLWMQYENVQRLKDKDKVNALIQLGGLPNLEGTEFRKQIEKEIAAAGGTIPKWAPEAVSPNPAVAEPGRQFTPPEAVQRASTVVGPLNVRRDRVAGINPRAPREVDVPSVQPGQRVAAPDDMAPAYSLEQALRDRGQVGAPPPPGVADLGIGEEAPFRNKATGEVQIWRMTMAGPLLVGRGMGGQRR